MNYKNKELLYEMYREKEMTLIEIAKAFNCNRSTIIKWMSKFNIPRRNKRI